MSEFPDPLCEFHGCDRRAWVVITFGLPSTARYACRRHQGETNPDCFPARPEWSPR